MANKKEYSFEQYKLDATRYDVKKFEAKAKPRSYENIPVIGALIYIWRMQINTWGIDRGPLRKNLNVKRIIFMFAFLIYLYSFLALLTPWFVYWHTNLAIKKTKAQIESRDL